MKVIESFKTAVTENTIGIMVGPVQGEGGVQPATKEFLVGLREYCDETGILLLLDKVQRMQRKTSTQKSGLLDRVQKEEIQKLYRKVL